MQRTDSTSQEKENFRQKDVQLWRWINPSSPISLENTLQLKLPLNAEYWVLLKEEAINFDVLLLAKINLTLIFCNKVDTQKNRRIIVYTDGAAFYSFLNHHNYERIIVNNIIDFCSLADITNHIESLWNQLKGVSKIKQKIKFSTVK